ncbi:hypothetical protein CEXT_717731 [Caerostris extrusa]|uniref:Ig-like domain-containing protein n=1 Tax=Caerostris extrusa TaxID=172846 RepID=A0AAV4RYT5_CAEEX|nr:hypothetical protein CEXT_717731 [Caerostris extrusa]
MKIIVLKVPPKFVDRGENEVMAREGTNITLSCKVKGYPLPTVTWEREGGQDITEEKGRMSQGQDLSIIKVSRLHMECMCAPPHLPSTRDQLISLPTDDLIPHQLIFASIGDTVSLDCYTEAFPMSINYWTKADSCNILQPSEKFSVSISDNIYQVSMKLVISGVDQEDFGSYKCIAKNSLGSTEGIIRLYEAKATIYNRKEAVEADEEEEKKWGEHVRLGVFIHFSWFGVWTSKGRRKASKTPVSGPPGGWRCLNVLPNPYSSASNDLRRGETFSSRDLSEIIFFW